MPEPCLQETGGGERNVTDMLPNFFVVDNIMLASLRNCPRRHFLLRPRRQGHSLLVSIRWQRHSLHFPEHDEFPRSQVIRSGVSTAVSIHLLYAVVLGLLCMHGGLPCGQHGSASSLLCASNLVLQKDEETPAWKALGHEGKNELRRRGVLRMLVRRQIVLLKAVLMVQR